MCCRAFSVATEYHNGCGGAVLITPVGWGVIQWVNMNDSMGSHRSPWMTLLLIHCVWEEKH